MPGVDSLVRVPPDSSGRAIATQTKVRGANSLEFQEVLVCYQADHVSSGVDVTAVSTAILAANASRRTLVLQNVSDTRIMCRFGATPSATVGAEQGFAVEPFGGSYSFIQAVDTRALNAVHGAPGSKHLLITECSG
jgi:hypothetical protein